MNTNRLDLNHNIQAKAISHITITFYLRMQQATVITMLRLLLMMMVMVMVAPQGMHAQTTCVAVTRLSSRITYITCIFQQDISDNNFNVQILPGDEANPETALACNKKDSGGLNCHMADGVEFDQHQEILRRFTFTRNATYNSVGSQYKCQVVPSSGSVESCPVVEIDIPEVPEPTSPPADTPPADTDGSGESPVGISLLVIIIVIFVALGICVALAYVKRDRITKWWTKHTIGLLGPEDLNDPEKHTSRDPKMPEGWPAYFFNMGWREAMAGEGRDTGNKDKGKQSPQPSQEQLQSKDDQQDRERDDNLAEGHARQPLLTNRRGSHRKTEEMRAGPIGTSIHESTKGEMYHDALYVQENPVSPSPATKYMKKLQAEQKKAEEKRVKRAKEAAEQRAKEIILTAESEAKRITDGAKGKSKEEIKKAKLEADRILKKGREGAKHMKEGTGKGDNEGNQEATATV